MIEHDEVLLKRHRCDGSSWYQQGYCNSACRLLCSMAVVMPIADRGDFAAFPKFAPAAGMDADASNGWSGLLNNARGGYRGRLGS